MLRSLIFLPAFLFAAVGGCNGSESAASPEVLEAATGAPFVLAEGESVDVAGRTLRFVDVIEDSRCPAGVTCVWEGRAKVRLAAANPEGAEWQQVLTLPYGGMTSEESSVWPVGGVEVELVDVLVMEDSDAPREVTLRVTPGT